MRSGLMKFSEIIFWRTNLWKYEKETSKGMFCESAEQCHIEKAKKTEEIDVPEIVSCDIRYISQAFLTNFFEHISIPVSSFKISEKERIIASTHGHKARLFFGDMRLVDLSSALA